LLIASLINVPIILLNICRQNLEDTTINDVCVVPTANVRTTTTGSEKFQDGVTFSGVMFIPNLSKIDQLVLIILIPVAEL
jgi:hypothetical protein